LLAWLFPPGCADRLIRCAEPRTARDAIAPGAREMTLKRLMRVAAFILGVLSLTVLWLPAHAEERDVRIGVLSFRDLELTRRQWQPTADYLNANVPGYRFSIEPMFFAQLDAAVNQRRFDFVLTNPEHYVELRQDHGLAAIATLMPVAEGHPVSSFGGVIVTRADRADIIDLADLRGKTVASPGEQSLGGYLMQRWTLFEQGIGIGDIGKMRFTGMPQDKAVMDVMAGKADAAFVRTGILESLAREDKLRLDQVKVLNRQQTKVFPQLLSTTLYPEWPFTSMPETSEALSKIVMQALLKISPEDDAARSGKYYGFTPPGNYAPVEAMMLRLGVLGREHDFDWRDVSRKYAVPLLGGAAALLLAMLASAIYLWRNYRHLRRTHRERDRLALELSEANATLEQKVERRTRALQSSETRFRQMFEHHASPMLLIDSASGSIVDANLASAEFYGYTVDWMRQMNMSQINTLPPGKIAEDRDKALRGECKHFVFPHRIANGELRIVEVHSSPVEVEGKSLLFSIVHDITERHAAEAKLRLRDAALNAAANAIIITATSGEIIWANEAFTELTGYASGETLGHKPKELVRSGMQDQSFYETLWQTVLAGHTWHGELVNRRKDGSLYNEEMTITPLKDDSGKVAYFIAVKQDISDRKNVEAQMHDLAFYDPLTHLPNRRLLLDRLDKALAASSRSRTHSALMFLDLDHFKKLNDVHGHDVGDLLLVEVAQRITGCIREEDSAARFGGDEFVIMLEDLSPNVQEAARQAESVAEKIRVVLAQPYRLKRTSVPDNGDAIEHHCTSSIGVTVFCDRDNSMDELLRWTDMAMYQAKTAGRNLIRFFDPDMQADIEARVAMEEELRAALEKGQLRLYYQVQVDNSRHAQSAEALLRWDHPRRGLIPPMQFIPLAEETGLILPIGQWVLDTACAQLAKWQAGPETRHLTLAVNVSAKQFRQADFVKQVTATVERHGISPLLLKLELTESTVLENADDAIAKMSALKEYGVKLSLDDFGTGYSSLSHLKRLPLDQIKIDQSFVRDVTTDNGDAVMVMTMVDLGMNFEVEVIAEGVETEEQFKALQRYGCGSLQGYLFSKPLPIEQFETLLHQGQGRHG
jgi:diguanylate cyclase (GGDEF)-like protein/PAS domain S-box-containing protein